MNYLCMVLVVTFCVQVVFKSVQKCRCIDLIHKLDQENTNGHRKRTYNVVARRKT